MKDAIDKAVEGLEDEDEDLGVPPNLKSQIDARLKEDRALTWDSALREIVEKAREE